METRPQIDTLVSFFNESVFSKDGSLDAFDGTILQQIKSMPEHESCAEITSTTPRASTIVSLTDLTTNLRKSYTPPTTRKAPKISRVELEIEYITSIFRDVLECRWAPESLVIQKNKSTRTTNLKLSSLADTIHFMLSYRLKVFVTDTIAFTKQESSQIIQSVCKHFNSEEQNAIVRTLTDAGIMTPSQRGIDVDFAVTSIETKSLHDPALYIHLNENNTPTPIDTEWALRTSSDESPPLIQDGCESIGGKTYALALVWRDLKQYPSWVLRKNHLQRKMSSSVKMENVYQLFNRVLSLLSGRNGFKLEQTLIHNVASWLYRNCPPDLIEAHEALIKTEFVVKPPQTLHRWLKKRDAIQIEEDLF
jgi:hypothetical protein